MDLTQAELSALVAELHRRAQASHRPAADGRPATNDVIEALSSGANASIFQPVYDRGFDVARARAGERERALTTERDTATARIATLEARVRELESNTPNAESLTKPLKDEITRLQGEIDKRARDEAQRTVRTNRQAELDKLEKYLVANKVHPTVAKGYVKDEANLARLEFDENGKLKDVLRRDAAVPLAAVNGKHPLELMAIELAEATDPKLRTSAITTTGAGDSASGTGGATGDAVSKFIEKRNQERAARPSPLKALGVVGGPATPPANGVPPA